MTKAKLAFPRFTIARPPGWSDITNSLHGERPFTVANEAHGVGAMQFSPALYKAGAVPRVCLSDLVVMLDDFARQHEFPKGFDNSTRDAPLLMAAESFDSGDDFIRVWYVSDGLNVMLVTYVCDWANRYVEAEAVEDIVQSIQFGPGLAPD
jgi:hypothetical protein